MAKKSEVDTSDLDRQIKKMISVATPNDLEAALIVGGLSILNKAKLNAPVKTGTLRRSLHIGGNTKLPSRPQYGTGENADQYSDIGVIKRKTRVLIKIGTNLEYAPFVEFGTKFQNAQPFLRNAYDEKKGTAFIRTREALLKILEKKIE